MSDLILPSPAKLNLCLHILGQRPDGYHELQTAFQLLSYGDEVGLSCCDSGAVSLESGMNATLPVADNLAYRAATLLKAETGCVKGARITLRKRLPAGGGIGGGSSNAATVLVGLNKLWGLNLTYSQLATLGRALGADVPVFVEGRSAWGEGVGERLQPVNFPEKWYVVITPDCHVATATIFSHKNLTRNASAITVAAFLEQGGRNDCQPLVESLFPSVKDAVLWLSQFGDAKVTGTGASVFLALESEAAAINVLTKKPSQWQGFIAKGVNVSSLHECI